jgi:hypothetical protein
LGCGGVDGTASEPCPMAGFVIVGAEYAGFSTGGFVIYKAK